MINEIFEFLNTQGLINFGVLKVRAKPPIGPLGLPCVPVAPLSLA